jgi:Fe-S-cluster containining protein
VSGVEGLCGRCSAPGACCRGFYLNARQLQAAESDVEALGILAGLYTVDCNGRPMLGLPFVPAGYRTSGAGKGSHPTRETPEDIRIFDCTLLGEDGRCTDYAHRPELCVRYEPGQDALCIMHVPAADAGSAEEAKA